MQLFFFYKEIYIYYYCILISIIKVFLQPRKETNHYNFLNVVSVSRIQHGGPSSGIGSFG